MSPAILSLVILSSIALLGATAEATTYTYTVNETITGPLNGIAGNPSQTDSVVGYIKTDGTIGSGNFLHASNILDWNLNLIDVTNPQYSYNLLKSNSLIAIDTGSVLWGDGTNLFFNFNGKGALGFQASFPGQYSGYHYWGLSHNENWVLLDGISIAPGHVFAGSAGNDLVVAGIGTQGQVGNSPLDQQPGDPSPVPEPSTMMFLSLGLLGLAGVRRKFKK